MTAQRAIAVVAAVVMIVGAWFVRDRVLDDNVDEAETSTGEVVCVTDLEEICRTLEDTLDVDVRIESVDDTLQVWGSADEIPNEVWITMAPFPDMAESLRTGARLPPADAQVEVVASSPLTLVALEDSAEEVTGTCGDPVDWACLGSDSNDLTVGFAPFPDFAIGQLGVTNAVVGYGGGSVPPASADFAVWARQISGASNNSPGAGSAVATIQTRPSFDIAVGAEAELTDANASRFVLLAPDGSMPIDVVLATPAGTSAPGGVADAVRKELTASGWTAPRTASAAVSATDMLAVREIWKDYQ